MLLNYGVGKDSWETLCSKETQPVNPKGNQPWIFTGRTYWSWKSNTLAPWCKELTHWERPWCWERLKAGGERNDRGWDRCMASLMRWTWVWVSSGSWWWTGKPGMRSPWGHRVWHAAAAAKSLQSCLTLCDPIDGSPQGSSVPGIPQVLLLVKNLSASASRCRRLGFDPWVRKIPWSRRWWPTPVLFAEKFSWPEELGGLWPMESQRARHDWAIVY